LKAVGAWNNEEVQEAVSLKVMLMLQKRPYRPTSS
jgi:hypothetical protein